MFQKSMFHERKKVICMKPGTVAMFFATVPGNIWVLKGATDRTSPAVRRQLMNVRLFL